MRFADAAVSLEDPMGVSVADPDSAGEARFIFLGADPAGRVLVTIYTLRGRTARVISSRKASRAERRAYEKSP
ncbi:MAG: BrnT family toxin [Dehalococcoidia bacterium]